MRGKGLLQIFISEPLGITPAYAGKRPGNVSGAHNVWDHPRVCGEKPRYASEPFLPQGSPPRMRGKGHVFFQLFPAHRITPAYAGKSLLICRKRICKRDHPRVCGEKTVFCAHAPKIVGSPPRMRGKDVHNLGYEHQYRITPAYAGKSFVYSCYGAFNRDHPRVCGEKTKKIP